MTTQPRLVNKQFNTPIGLYSEQNVREVLQREQQILANGAIGIDFHNSSTGKPANLQNSAVLRLLEEEENRRGGRPANDEYYPRPLRDVSWPPPDYDKKTQLRSSFKDVVTPGKTYQFLNLLKQTSTKLCFYQGGPQYSSPSPGLQQNNYPSQQQGVPVQQSYRPLKPLDVSSVGAGSPLTSPALNQTPQGFRSATPSGPKGWAPVQSPTTPLGPGAQKYFGAPPAQGYQGQPQYQPVSQPHQAAQQYQPSLQQYQQPNQYGSQPSGFATPPAHQYQAPPQQYQPQPAAQPIPAQSQIPAKPAVAQPQPAAPRPQPAKHVEPPPSTITLRPAAPISQTPAPVYSAQPATASLKGGKNLRGDLKWPPENVRQRMAEEQAFIEEISKGPAVKPSRKERDYTPFFAQHALNSTYPGYKIPPGTQYFRPEY
uniref:Zasp-like motif domain-containing protein n=1 Tax=Dendroctonus ponderosae TaxID=77166 RepID=A0AAR5PYM3_DENPD